MDATVFVAAQPWFSAAAALLLLACMSLYIFDYPHFVIGTVLWGTVANLVIEGKTCDAVDLDIPDIPATLTINGILGIDLPPPQGLPINDISMYIKNMTY